MMMMMMLPTPFEASDHLFLLPQRALGMDSSQLKQDLESLGISNIQLNRLHEAPRGNFWLSGTAPQDSQTSNETHRNSFTKGAADRVRLVRERQNEERQRRLEELRQHALSAQRFREQREEERTHRIEELRSKYNLRRSQAEERRKQMWDAVQERREAILRKHQQERKVRQEVKARNERSQIVFAFGSSTPRMLEPADTGGYLSGRRATSTSNVSNLQQQQINPLTRRSSERELDGSKKRATSAGGLERKPGQGVRSGDVTPTNGPSRPLSAMSQQNTSVNLRPRTSPTITNSRRPRPASIAGTGVSSSNCSNSISTKTPTSSSRKSATGTLRSSRTSPRVTPKATPLQSPAVELPKPPVEDITIQPPEVTEISEPEVSEQTPSKEVKLAPPLIEEPVTEETLSNHSEEAEIKNLEVNFEEQCDMTASMIQKIRITTEEEAKAALAERRRLAREQAEREAEQERLRLEEEARLEAERLRKEEEEQKRLEEETLRLVQEARESEEQRLKLAIEEAKKREEEDRKRREEEAKQKLEKEEAERKAREEAEKQRLEMVERLKKEEEERNARRKRVEAIMSRTRAKNQASNPKSETEDSKSQELSPNDEVHLSPEDVKNSTVAMTTSQQLIKSEQLEQRSENGTHTNGHIETKSKIESEEFNGHHGNGLDESKISVDNSSVKQNNVTNNLLDLSDFDGLCNTNSNNSEDILLVPEDNINSNLNPTTISFTPMVPINVNNTSPFQEALTNNKPQENQLPDLLS